MASTECSLGFFNFTTQFLNSAIVLTDIFSGFLFVKLDEILHYSLVKIFTTQVSVTTGCYDFEYASVNSNNTHVKSSTSQIKDQNVLFLFLLV